jgi:hypothetical protein
MPCVSSPVLDRVPAGRHGYQPLQIALIASLNLTARNDIGTRVAARSDI